jgi:hypothetical protein
MATPTSPFMDHAAPVLNADPTLNDQQRSDLWDAFHSKNSDELVQHLTPLAIPDDTKHKLFQAKQLASPPAKIEPVDKVTAALNKMAALPPDVLEKAESHPQVMKAFTTAAVTPEKEPVAAPSEPAVAPKGKKTPEAEEAPQVPTDVPATPSQHALIHASNGAHYHVPVDRLDKAKEIDPNLTVLHVEP